MSYETIAAAVGGSFQRLSTTSGYIHTPLVMPEDGAMIGAYVIDAPDHQVRITDDANVLYRAALHGMTQSPARSRQIQAIAEGLGLAISNDGEIHVTCSEENAPFFLARFLEAADRISFMCVGYRPKATTRFERKIGEVLKAAFPEQLVRAPSVTGASGHDLRFPFMLNEVGDRRAVIQPIAAKEGKVDWASVYHAVGKFIDLKNNPVSDFRRVAVLESMEDANIEKAKVALAEASSVIVFQSNQQFVETLRQAA
ncbi:DUF1828 domain-containing protein [Stenotrophomonas maltophilia]|uniref:DUF1828 domain-containing protein n=1 Tax=Stenotrophomonas maltophilia TaxID=40324 RepID=UPI0013DD0109|nr:DUF1828 domain-containing protein [Stenotrophomonas maltophilia]